MTKLKIKEKCRRMLHYINKIMRPSCTRKQLVICLTRYSRKKYDKNSLYKSKILF